MLKKLKRRFVANVMLVLVVVFLLMTVGFHLFYNYENRKENEALLYWVANTGSISTEEIENYYLGKEELEDTSGKESTSIGLAAIKYDTSGNFLSIESTETLSPQKEDELLRTGEKILNGTHPATKKLTYKLMKKDYGYYLVLLNTSGSILIFQYSEYLVAAGIFLAVLILLFFVSLLLSRFVTKPAENSLNKQKQFISDASHELKTPLAAILLNAEALASSNEGNQNLQNIISEASRMDRLIQNLLELARADDVTHKLVMEDFNLSDAVLQITLPFESRAYESNIQLDTDIEEDLLYHGSSDDIKQVIAILIDNAFKHVKEGGRILITLDHTGSAKRLRIFNTGDGISDADLPHIFDRFYSCDQSRGGIRKSYGLGLAIAKAIVEKHGGSITVHSEYGKNAEFIILLPQPSRKKTRIS
ncbi:MAG: HAMP domain-containing sensor histidine kinase [Eubacteriales bacterium]|nr:HAMP domain-containing sensor histidine kinase [Eubacteriales bacterium]